MDADTNERQCDDPRSERLPPQAPYRSTESSSGLTIDGAADLLLDQDTDDSEDFFWPAVGR
jgi:hypothetical protein